MNKSSGMSGTRDDLTELVEFAEGLQAGSWKRSVLRFGQPPGYVSACEVAPGGSWLVCLWRYPGDLRVPQFSFYAPDGVEAALAAQRMMPGARTVPGPDSGAPARKWLQVVRAQRAAVSPLATRPSDPGSPRASGGF